MSLVLQGSTSGSITLQEPAVAGSTVLNLPATSGTILTSASSIATSQLTGSVTRSQLPTGSVLQVVSTTKTNTFTTTSSSFVDITGMSATITPTSSSSKILCIFTAYGTHANSGSNYAIFGQFVRGSTAISLGDSRGSSTRASFTAIYNTPNYSTFFGGSFLDSPSTTSSTTYKVQMAVESGGTGIVGGSYNDGGAYNQSVPSTLTLIEIAA
jgi:hypothetical protein